MSCKETEIMLIEKMFGKLSAPDQARLEEHLRSCPACRRLAARSPDLSGQHKADGDISLPDKEATWQVILSLTARKKSRIPAAFWKWTTAAAGLAVTALLAIMIGRGGFVRRAKDIPVPWSTAPASSLSGYADGVEMVLISVLKGASEGDLSKAEDRLIENLLLQTRVLKRAFARQGDPQGLELIDDIEMILIDLAHLKAGDRTSRNFLNRQIEAKDLKFRLKVLASPNVGL
jgi:hypothetical protein